MLLAPTVGGPVLLARLGWRQRRLHERGYASPVYDRPRLCPHRPRLVLQRVVQLEWYANCTSSIPYLIHANLSDPIAVHRCSVEVPVVDDINWYVNWQKYICVKNCPKGSLDENGNVDPLCGGISLRWECESLQFCASFTQTNLTPSCALTRMMRNNAVPFTLLSECCHAMLGHQHADQCIRDSLHRDTKHYTGRFYVNNREQRCEFMSC